MSSSKLSLSQAALLAAVLPNPKQRSAVNPSKFVQKRALSIADGASTILKDERSDCFTD
jgi:monofunctional biosynthetic peptidoglycan transglycosylase